MKACLVLNDDMQASGIRACDLFEKHGVDVLVDGRGEEEFHLVDTIDFERFLEVAPFITGGGGAMARTPRLHQTLRMDGKQPVAVLVGVRKRPGLSVC